MRGKIGTRTNADERGQEKIKIRKVKRSDFEEIFEMMRVEYGKHFGDKWTRVSLEKVLEGLWKTANMFVMECKNQVAGFIAFREKYCDAGNTVMIEELVVLGKMQGKGIGKMLMNFVEDYCKKNNVRFIWLFTGKNSDAFKFYKNIGYKYGKNTAFLSKDIK